MNFRDSRWDRDLVVYNLVKDIPLPRMALVSQRFEDVSINDIPSAVRKEFDRPEISSRIKKDMSIAVTAGSRGIAHIALIIKEVVWNLKRLGASPFVIPAMGSHGGGTAEGQAGVLSGFGITEDYIGAPILATMETVCIGKTENGEPVLIDKYAAEADGIVVVGRIKPHTAFRGRYESGLFKMMAIGLGKLAGANVCHSEGFGGMAKQVEKFGNAVLRNANILFGIGIVENAFDDTALIEAVPSELIPEREPDLLMLAKTLLPKLFIQDFDILITDSLGKNFSGAGQDPNITGSYMSPYASGGPSVKRYVVLDMSEESHGNPLGIGRADITTKRFFDKIDFDSAYPNALTCGLLMGVKVPLVVNNDRLAVQGAIKSLPEPCRSNPRIIRIENSSQVERILVSESLEEEIAKHPEMTLMSSFKEMPFDENGNFSHCDYKTY